MLANLSEKMLAKLETYKADANKCTLLKYIYTQSDINEDDDESSAGVFKPEYTHQIFGDDECIFGFKNLRVHYYLTPGAMHTYIGLKYAEKITPKKFDGIEADDVYDAFQQFGLSPGFTRSLDTFCTDKLKQDLEFRPFGEKIHEYTRNAKQYEVYKVDLNCADYQNKKFVDYLLRVQSMLMFFIETADFTDTDDDQWVYYFAYEKQQVSGAGRYVTIGFTSVYTSYAYPDKKRTRISQMLVMPPFQHAGHGAQLMECIYNDANQNPLIIDVTAEGPSDNYIKLRDYVTCKMCMQLSSFKDKSKLKEVFSVEMCQEAMAKFKLPKLQTRRCYEILRLQVTNQNNQAEWRDYRLNIKKRLNVPFVRNAKFARNAGNVVNTDDSTTSAAAAVVQTSVSDKLSFVQTFGSDKRKEKIIQMLDRFGAPDSSTSIGFGRSTIPEEEENGTTTIGFGNGSNSAILSLQGVKRPLDVLFGGPEKRVAFANNASNGDNDDDDDDDDDDESSDDESTANQNTSNQVAINSSEPLFMNEDQRKDYLEKEFNNLVVDYRDTLRRLENSA